MNLVRRPLDYLHLFFLSPSGTNEEKKATQMEPAGVGINQEKLVHPSSTRTWEPTKQVMPMPAFAVSEQYSNLWSQKTAKTLFLCVVVCISLGFVSLHLKDAVLTCENTACSFFPQRKKVAQLLHFIKHYPIPCLSIANKAL